mgnify:FL=1|tara:strand:+ start:466 stop:1239 length:774 start_codon:yes stop_codon:yes gene_type:complete
MLSPLIASALVSRRLFVGSGAAALLAAPSAAQASTSITEAFTDPRKAGFQRPEVVQWGPFSGLSNAQIDELDEKSQDPFAGFLLPSGVRVIDLIEGEGKEAKPGDRIYVTYKVWAKGFRNGVVADWSYMDGRPYGYIFGLPTSRIPPGVDEGLRGMREGGWRRLVVPDAFGTAGLRRQVPVRGGGRSQPPYAGFVVSPGAFAWFDVILVDAGSGRCDAVLRPAGVSEERAAQLRSLTCLPGEISTEFNMGTGVVVPK